jgi:hypothetical protein
VLCPQRIGLLRIYAQLLDRLLYARRLDLTTTRELIDGG